MKMLPMLEFFIQPYCFSIFRLTDQSVITQDKEFLNGYYVKIHLKFLFFTSDRNHKGSFCATFTNLNL